MPRVYNAHKRDAPSGAVYVGRPSNQTIRTIDGGRMPSDRGMGQPLPA